MSSQNSKWSAEYCIDGNIHSPSNGRPAVCTTKKEPAPWLALDFSSPICVESVTLYTRKDCCGQRTRNVEVRVSNELPTTADVMFLGGEFLGGYKGPAQNGEIVNITSSQTLQGRYVIIQMDSNDYLDLAEVKVIQGDSWSEFLFITRQP